MGFSWSWFLKSKTKKTSIWNVPNAVWVMSFYERVVEEYKKELNDRFMDLIMYGQTKAHINLDEIRAMVRQEQFNNYLTELENAD